MKKHLSSKSLMISAAATSSLFGLALSLTQIKANDEITETQPIEISETVLFENQESSYYDAETFYIEEEITLSNEEDLNTADELPESTSEISSDSSDTEEGNLESYEEPAVTEAGGAGTAGFKDITPGDGSWYNDVVFEANELGLITGYDNGYFGPDNNMTRAEACTVIYRMFGSPQTSFVKLFNDVNDGNFYSSAITWAAQNGVMTGYNSTTFGVNDNITREQIATVLWRLYGRDHDNSSNQNLSYYTDKDKIDSYAYDAMKWVVEKGIIQGANNKRNLNPISNATRAEMAKIFVLANDLFKNGAVRTLTGLNMEIDGSLSYINASNQRESGVKTVDGETYYFSPANNNLAVKNYYYTDGATGYSYYFGQDCTAQTGAVKINGKYYYFASNGVQIKQSFTANKTSFTIDSSTGELTSVVVNNVNILMQTDSRWAWNTVGGYTVKSTGCMPSCMATIVNWFNDTNITPYQMYVNHYNNQLGYPYDNCDGAIFWTAENYNLKATSLSTTDKTEMISALMNGSLVTIALGGTWMHGIFGTHQLIFGGYKDGKTYAYDPYFTQNTGWFTLDSIFSNLSTDHGDIANGGPIIAISRS
jgi:glucan-binding YG repeat protein